MRFGALLQMYKNVSLENEIYMNFFQKFRGGNALVYHALWITVRTTAKNKDSDTKRPEIRLPSSICLDY